MVVSIGESLAARVKVSEALRSVPSERLRGQWGIADVNDSARAVSLLGHLVDEKRALIRGGSAGGYTVLQVLTTPSTAKTFAGGTSSYGISDLEALMHDTHKFESHYLFKLIGAKSGNEEDKEWKRVCVERSPLKNAKHIRAPVLVSEIMDHLLLAQKLTRVACARSCKDQKTRWCLPIRLRQLSRRSARTCMAKSNTRFLRARDMVGVRVKISRRLWKKSWVSMRRFWA